MRIFKLSFLGVLASLLFIGCQKDVQSELGAPSGNHGENNGNDKVDPVITTTYGANSTTTCVNEPVTITGTVNQTCGQIKLQQWNGTDWVPVTDFVDVNTTNQTVTHTFTPTAVTTAACELKFRTQYNPGGGDCGGAVKAGFSDAICINVVNCNPCDVTAPLTLTKGTACAVNNNDGTYTITYTYTLTSCAAVTGVKTQGGLSAGGNTPGATFVSGTSSTGTNAVLVNENNNNSVYKFTEDIAANQTITYTVVYTRQVRECGVQSVSGSWSSEANGITTANAPAHSIDPCTTPCN